MDALDLSETLVISYQNTQHRIWTVRRSNPAGGGGKILRTRPDVPWVPPSLSYNGYRISFPGVKLPRRSVDRPSPFSAEVKERV